MRKTKRGIADLFGFAGLVLVAVASGALFTGSTVASVPDVTIAASAQTGGAASMTTQPAGAAPVAPAANEAATVASTETSSGAAVPTLAPTTTTSSQESADGASQAPAQERAQPEIAPSPVTHVRIPSIAVDAAVLPVDSKPTGKTNAWGGPIYSTLEFPVDEDVRQWIRRGDPNTLSATESAGNAKAFDRVMLYGHASDIGNHLVFQDLSALKPHDPVVVTTKLGTFIYRVTTVVTRAKTNLNDLAALYDYPKDGAKEIALVACLPDTTSNVVVFGTLDRAIPADAATSANSPTDSTRPDAG